MTVALDVILLLAALLPLVWKRAVHSLELFLLLLGGAAAAVAGAALLSRIISGGTHPRQCAQPDCCGAAFHHQPRMGVPLTASLLLGMFFVVFRQIIIRFCHILSYLFFRLIVV